MRRWRESTSNTAPCAGFVSARPTKNACKSAVGAFAALCKGNGGTAIARSDDGLHRFPAVREVESSQGSSGSPTMWSMADDEPPDFNSMGLGKVKRLAAAGDEGAQTALDEFGADLVPLFERAHAAATSSVAALSQSIQVDTEVVRAAWAEKDRKEREAVAREETVVLELAEMRRAALRADEREAAAVERAEAAERREVSAEERAERRERFMVRLTVASVAFGAVGAVAAVVAIFAG
jgi:hypothetical protein